MPFCRKFLFLQGCFWLFFALFSTYTFAQSSAPEAVKPSDVRMVIDISGSMKKNDPDNLRRPALDMLIQLLPENSKAGVWSFGRSVNMLVPHKKTNKAWGKEASKAALKINSVGQFTNIGGALETAAYDAKNSSQTGNYQKHVILLTDGMVDIDRDSTVNERERQRIIDEVLPLYKQAGFTLHTIALSDNADKELLDKLALATDGKSAIARTSEELMAVLLSVFDQAVPAEEAPFDGDSFIVDSSIEEFTALIFRKKGSGDAKVISPDGTAYSKDATDKYVTWYHTSAYDLITVKSPLEGEWRVEAEIEPQSRITVVSDLRLLVSPIPRNLGLDEEVKATVAFQEEGKIVTRVEFLGLLDIDMMVRTPSGNISSKRISKGLLPDDGLYPANLNHFSQEGEYTINFIVDGKSFNRKYSHTVSVRKPLAVKVEQTGSDSSPEFVIDVIPQIQEIDTANSRIYARLKSPDGQVESLRFDATPDGKWTATVNALQQGDYVLTVTPRVVDNKGKTINASLEPVVLGSNSSGPAPAPEPEPAPEPVVEEEPVVEPEVEEPVVEEEPEESSAEDDKKMMDYILYGSIAGVNLLVILIIFMIYRKLFKKPADDLDDDLIEDEGEDEFTEPPMDEMAVEEIEDDFDDPEAASEPSPESKPKEVAAAPDETPSDDLDVESSGDDELDDDEPDIALGMDDDDIDLDEDEPDVSLDDLSPESLDDDDVSDFDEDKK